MISLSLRVAPRRTDDGYRLWATGWCWFCLKWRNVRYLGPITTPDGTAPVSGCRSCLTPRLRLAARYAAEPTVDVLNYPEMSGWKR